MNKCKTLFVSLFSLLSLSLSSCQKKPDVVRAEGYDDCIAEYKETFAKSLSEENVTVTWTEARESYRYTEKIKGNVSYFLQEKETFDEYRREMYVPFAERWSYVDGDKMISATKTYFDEDGETEKQASSYKRGAEAYNSTYKHYLSFFDVFEHVQDYFKPSSKEGCEKDYSQYVNYRWFRFNDSNTYGRDQDYFLFDTHTNDDNWATPASIRGHIDAKTELVLDTDMFFHFPTPDYSPFDATLKWYRFEMSYGDKEKIDLPDISSWEDRT